MALYTSILNGGTNSHPTTSEEANYYATDFVNDGVLGTFTNTNSVAPMTGAFAVNAQGTPDMTVAVTAGAAYVTATPSGQASQTLRVRLSANENVTITSNSSGSTKYDWVYLKIDPTTANNPNLAGDDVATLVTSRSTSSTTDDGTPPTYGLVLAVVTVANGASSITNGNIRDKRVQASATSVDTAVTTGWIDNALPSVSSVTANGNRSYTIAFASTVASQLSAGMRLKTERTSAATTNAFSLDGSNDYYSKTLPNGLSFTTTFTCSAWIYMTAYQAGYIINRRNASTEGWSFLVNADGTVELAGLRIASNNKKIASYQSIPLNRWVHVAATMDMAAGDTTAQKIWIDGVEVPRAYTLTGTATALVQGTTALAVGARSDGSSPFPGYIDQAAVFSSQLSDATIKAMINQGLTGSESTLVSAFANGSTTDLNTTNANNLTAQGGATTVASAPWGNRGTSSTLDYALVMAVSGANVTVQVPEGCTIPTTGGVSAVAYSTQKNPYGWVAPEGRWRIHTKGLATFTQSSPVSGTWYNINFQIYKPTGYFEAAVEVTPYAQNTTQIDMRVDATLSTTTSTETDTDLSMRTGWSGASGSLTLFTQASRRKTLDSSTAGTYYLLTQVNTATHTIVGLLGKNNLYLTPSGL